LGQVSIGRSTPIWRLFPLKDNVLNNCHLGLSPLGLNETEKAFPESNAGSINSAWLMLGAILGDARQ
jgi:hypothetical protein